MRNQLTFNGFWRCNRRYEWAVDNNIQLIDEYDHIYHHIEPFHSLPIAELHHRITRLSDPQGEGQDHEILTLRDGKRTYSGAKWRTPVGESFDGLLEGIAHLLPDMVVPLYLHDASHTQMDYEWMQAYRKSAKEGKSEFNWPRAAERTGGGRGKTELIFPFCSD